MISKEKKAAIIAEYAENRATQVHRKFRSQFLQRESQSSQSI